MKPPKLPETREVGAYFEQVAQKQLKKDGYHILATNQTLGAYELDIIAKKGMTVVFVEVKARGPSSLFLPQQAVDRKKQQHLLYAAHRYLRILQRHGVQIFHYRYRFDVIAIQFDRAYHVTAYQHLEHYMEVSDETLFGSALRYADGSL